MVFSNVPGDNGTDQLTGLPNGSSSERALITLISFVQRGIFPFLMLGMCDADNLKVVNDDEGHIEGNQAIQEISRRLAAQFRTHDLTCNLNGTIVGRFGGDEFVLGLPCLHESDVEVMKDRIVAAQQSEWICNDYPYSLPLSVGLRVIRPDDLPHSGPITVNTIERFMREADRAQRIAKLDGKGCADRRQGIVLYTPEVEARYIQNRDQQRAARRLAQEQRGGV